MSLARRTLHSLIDSFRVERKVAWSTLAAFVFINAIVFLNALLHDPKVGYDAPAHLKYVQKLALGRLPTSVESREFFSPPLPYLPAALFWASLDAAGRDGRAELALKLAQLVQACYSLALTFFVVKLARCVRGGVFLPTASLLLLGMVPAYYRTFAMIRGEPLLATLAIAGTYLTLRTFALRRPTLGAAAVLGVTLGLAALSRQWAFFLLPPLALVGLWRLIIDRQARGATLRAGVLTLTLFAVVAGPFYLHLHQTYGSIRAFNRTEGDDNVSATSGASNDSTNLPSTTTSMASNPWKRMTVAPVRHAFADQPVLLFYADAWGDYWQDFLLFAKDRRGNFVKPAAVDRTFREGKAKASNYATMPAYLGRMCVAGIVPTLAFVAGTIGGLLALKRVITNRRTLTVDDTAIVRVTLALSVVTTLLGYGWFVWTYPNDHGDTIKASYVLQIYAPLAILAATIIGDLGRRWPRGGLMLVGLLALIALHNLPACVTRYR